jgi:pilus assembly protein CpaC
MPTQNASAVPSPRSGRPRGGFAQALAGVMLAVVALATADLASPVLAAGLTTQTGSSVTIEAEKGAMVRLDRPAAAVFVADPQICDIQLASPRLVYLLAKKPGQTTFYAADEAEQVVAGVEITVVPNLSSLKNAVRTLYPASDVSFSGVGDAVVIEGLVDDPASSEGIRRLAARAIGEKGEVINRLSVAQPTQVNLRVRVAEVSRNLEKQLGINWSVISRDGFNFAFATINPFAATGVATDVIGIGGSGNGWDVNAVIDALNDERLITILAEPNLTAMSGETASFLAGGEFPILVPQGNDQVTVEFKKFGVSLAFTPTVVSSNRINMRVRPEVSDLSDRGAIVVPIGNGQVLTVPALTTRRAETTVELGSGQSFAIAGLLSNDTDHDVKKLPLLGDIPVLGRLFTSDRFRRKESELVIIVTPYFVRPASGRLAMPTDGFAPPTDLQRLTPGGTWQRSPAAGAPSTVGPAGTRVESPVGFALE